MHLKYQKCHYVNRIIIIMIKLGYRSYDALWS